MSTDDSAHHWLQLGASFRQQQRWSEAADAFRQSLARDPTSALAWSMLGRAEQNLGHYDQAEQAFQNALAFAPGNVETLICYAFLLNQRSQPAQAIKLLEQA